jgi:hypothetical protein
VSPITGLHIDPKAAWGAFVEEHGDGVACDGVLLFRDGWKHEMSYGGPATPPPDDLVQLRRLQIQFWRLLRVVVTEQIATLEARLAEINRLPPGAPVQTAAIAVGASGRPVFTSRDVDPEEVQGWRDALEWRRNVVLPECEANLA